MKGWTHRPKNDPRWGIRSHVVKSSWVFNMVNHFVPYKTNAKRRKKLKQFFEPGEVKGEVNKKV